MSPEGGFCRSDDLRRLRDRGNLEVPGVGYRHFFAANPADRPVEVPERLLDNARADFGRQATAPPPLIDHDSAACLRRQTP